MQHIRENNNVCLGTSINGLSCNKCISGCTICQQKNDTTLHEAAASGSVNKIRHILDNGGLEGINSKDGVSVS